MKKGKGELSSSRAELEHTQKHDKEEADFG